MDNKKYLSLKIVHLVFMVLGLCLYIYSLLQASSAPSNISTILYILRYLQSGAAILALISGFLYLVHGYKKNAAAYFKGYVWILLIKEIISTVSGNGSPSYLHKFTWTIVLVLMTILVVTKDLGKTKSFALVGLILTGKIILLISSLSALQTPNIAGVPIIMDTIGQIVLTITTGLMVCGKYIDKDSRGAK